MSWEREILFDPAQVERSAGRQADAQRFTGVIYIEVEGREPITLCCGMADRSSSIPHTVQTRLPIASGSKIFTSVAIGQLVERGRVAVTTPLQQYVPSFDPAITLGHLLTHTSGLPDYHGDDYEAVWKEVPVSAMRSPSDYLPLIPNHGTRFAPGSRFEYNDAGFVLLGLILEQVTGERFHDYVQSNVFARAGMTDSGYFMLDQLPERTALAYVEDPDRGSWRTNVYSVPIVGGPDGGAFTTGSDMGRFWKALRSHELLGAASTQTLLEPHVETTGERPSTHYGYGVWIVQKSGGPPIHYVSGWDPGVTFLSAAHRGGRVLITILGNSNCRIWPIHDEIAAHLEPGGIS